MIKLKKISIDNFRKFKELPSINVGRKITIFSGLNGVGKSNILSIIASGSGLTSKRTSGGSFQPDFNEYFNIEPNENFDEYRIKFQYISDSPEGIIPKRMGFKDDTENNRGIRVLPRSSNYGIEEKTISDVTKMIKDSYDIGDSGRIPLPTVFISLSRLFPIGETELQISKVTKRNAFFKTKADQKYIEWYNAVLPNSIDPNTTKVELMSKKMIGNKKSFYISLNDSTSNTQSVGQDNLGQIISSLVDFYILSETSPETYPGGVLCIDEIDASLHPSAQQRLIELLNIISDELNLQIFLSTHSLTIIKELIKLNESEPENQEQNNYEIIYFKDKQMPYPTSVKNYRSLKSDLFDELNVPHPKITLYSEDETTKKVLKLILNAAHTNNLLVKYPLPEFYVIPVHLGCNHLLTLPKYDPYFKNDISIILDGDARSHQKIEISKFIKDPDMCKGFSTIWHHKNTTMLPGFLAPESYLYYIVYEYTTNNTQHIDFWRSLGNNPNTSNYTSGRVRDKLVDLQFDLTNDNLKKEPYSQELFDFVDNSNILSDYYNSEKYPANFKVLEKFVQDFQASLQFAQKSLQARGY